MSFLLSVKIPDQKAFFFSSFKHVLQGPLSVYPPAEDNYGCDACSILYINSSPPTVVIATSEGKLHHCILLSSENSTVQSDVIILNSSICVASYV